MAVLFKRAGTVMSLQVMLGGRSPERSGLGGTERMASRDWCAAWYLTIGLCMERPCRGCKEGDDGRGRQAPIEREYQGSSVEKWS
jgi:hypothetical protein